MEYNKLKKCKAAELVYKFLFWFAIAFSLHILVFNGIRGSAFKKAITSLPSSEYASIFLTFGILVAIISVLFKDIRFSINKKNSPSFIAKEASSLFAKISSDLLLVTYEITSFLTGTGCYLYFAGEFQGIEISKLSIISLKILLLLLFIATLSIVVRSSIVDSYLLKNWFSTKPFLYRLFAYIFLSILFFLKLTQF